VEVKLLQIKEWNDAKKAEQVMRQIRNKKIWTGAFKSCSDAVEDLGVLYDFYKEQAATEEELEAQFKLASTRVEDLEFKNMLSAEEDGLNAVLQITAGAGGPEEWLHREGARYARR